MSREPQAVTESLGGSRVSNELNTHSFSIAPVNGRMSIEVRAAGSREVRPNIQQFQDL
jgi:hypothetical protein